MKHLACVMDGNRRWARKSNLIAMYGHKEGVEAVKKAIAFCLDKQIEYLSLYTFSIENAQRSEEEKSYLFGLIMEQAQQQLPTFIKHGIRVRFIGERSLFPAHILPICDLVEDRTAECTALNINFLFFYGARQELVSGLKKIISKIKSGLLTEDAVTDQMISDHLWTAGMPEPDMIIRTGGVKRLSNFLLYQAAYSEFYFLDCMWPEISRSHFEAAYSSYEATQRNFGI